MALATSSGSPTLLIGVAFPISSITCSTVFPVVLDVENPEFYGRLETCVKNNEKLREIDASNSPAPVKFLRKLPAFVSNGVQFIKLYFVKPIRVDHLEGTVR